MWDEEDGFFYDVLQLPDGQAQRLKVRSMVGLLPLCAVTVFDGEFLKNHPDVQMRLKGFLEARPELRTFIHDPAKTGCAGRRLGAIMDETKRRRVLAKMLDENEFLSPYGLRALSRFHADHPYVFHAGGQEFRVPISRANPTRACSVATRTGAARSGCRSTLIIRAMLQYYAYYGNAFTVECPTGSGRQMNLYQIAEELTQRLASIFLKDTVHLVRRNVEQRALSLPDGIQDALGSDHVCPEKRRGIEDAPVHVALYKQSG